MNEQLEKIKTDLDQIRKSKRVVFQYGNYHQRDENIKDYDESDKYCGGRIKQKESECKVYITILEKDSFEIVVDVLMKSYQFIDAVDKLYLYRLNSPSFQEALEFYLRESK